MKGQGDVETGLEDAASRVQAKAVEVMEDILGLATFCNGAGAAKDLEVGDTMEGALCRVMRRY